MHVFYYITWRLMTTAETELPCSRLLTHNSEHRKSCLAVWGALLHLEWMSSSYSLTIQHSGTASCVSEDPLSLDRLFIRW